MRVIRMADLRLDPWIRKAL